MGKAQTVGSTKYDEGKFMNYVEKINGKQEGTGIWTEIEFKNKKANKQIYFA